MLKEQNLETGSNVSFISWYYLCKQRFCTGNLMDWYNFALVILSVIFVLTHIKTASKWWQWCRRRFGGCVGEKLTSVIIDVHSLSAELGVIETLTTKHTLEVTGSYNSNNNNSSDTTTTTTTTTTTVTVEENPCASINSAEYIGFGRGIGFFN